MFGFIEEMPTALDCGLSAWRILSGFPYYKLIEDNHIDIQVSCAMNLTL
jgi:hypothetical protein